jgi:phospholipid/cholesterol/gamma-HCH transport system permease protein
MKGKAAHNATTPDTGNAANRLSLERTAAGVMVIRLAGDWQIEGGIPSIEEVTSQLESAPPIHRVVLDAKALRQWDSSLLTFLLKLTHLCDQKKMGIQKRGIPQGVQRLLKLAAAVPKKEDADPVSKSEPILSKIGASALTSFQSTGEILRFIGEAFLALLKLLLGRASFRRSDLILIVQETGAQALPIVSLISLLVGLILAFVGAIQLKMFGAQIYVANLVGIAMVRVMGAVMTGIIMAGRTGAAFAAQLGTMQVNEEIDALTTLGISPMQFLILPRMLALVLMMPLLCLYADLMGVLGGLIVSVGMLDVNMLEYYNQTKVAVRLTDLWIGLVHSVVFGVLVSLSGCLRGIQCGRSAQAVGYATTSAVVTSIVSIIVATAIITIICNELGI